MVFSIISPGAAMAHDPDAHGWLLHRVIAHAPGGSAADMSDVMLDAAGDARMTARFIDEAISAAGRRPALAILWLGEPDATQHLHPPGSPEAWAAIAAADVRLGEVMAAVDRLWESGEAVLLLAGSDHGHETVEGIVDVGAELAAAGLKAGPDDTEDGLLPLSNGTSVLVHLAPHRDPAPVLAFLRAQAWAGQVLEGDALRAVGQEPGGDGLLCAVSMARRGDANRFGLGGLSLAAKPWAGKLDRLGCGQHGGLGASEQAAIMVADGPGFHAGKVSLAAASPIDLAPTILAAIGLGDAGITMDGQTLQGRPG